MIMVLPEGKALTSERTRFGWPARNSVGKQPRPCRGIRISRSSLTKKKKKKKKKKEASIEPAGWMAVNASGLIVTFVQKGTRFAGVHFTR